MEQLNDTSLPTDQGSLKTQRPLESIPHTVVNLSSSVTSHHVWSLFLQTFNISFSFCCAGSVSVECSWVSTLLTSNSACLGYHTNPCVLCQQGANTKYFQFSKTGSPDYSRLIRNIVTAIILAVVMIILILFETETQYVARFTSKSLPLKWSHCRCDP